MFFSVFTSENWLGYFAGDWRNGFHTKPVSIPSGSHKQNSIGFLQTLQSFRLLKKKDIKHFKLIVWILDFHTIKINDSGLVSNSL